MSRFRELVEATKGNPRTVRRRLAGLVEEGAVETSARGLYALPPEALNPLHGPGADLLGILHEGDYRAHITGLDVLVGYAHQFVLHHPHLVYGDPEQLDSLGFELASKDLIVARLGAGKPPEVADPGRLVFLRGQPNAERYRVRRHLAPPEKAWVDLLRETLRDNIPIQYMELGRMLRALLGHGGDLRFLRFYARQLGYLDRVIAAMEGAPPGSADYLAALHAGYAS